MNKISRVPQKSQLGEDIRYTDRKEGYHGGFSAAEMVIPVLVFLPAGVGAREAMLALAMAPVLGTGGILVVVLLSRVLLTVADLASAGLALAVSRALPPDR